MYGSALLGGLGEEGCHELIETFRAAFGAFVPALLQLLYGKLNRKPFLALLALEIVARHPDTTSPETLPLPFRGDIF